MIDLNQVSLALRNATPRSLILLDEFGKGTIDTGSCISLGLLGLDSNLLLLLGVTLSRWRGPLCWSLAAPACARF